MTKRRFVVLDRDGTLIVERNYLADPDLVELIPGAAKSLRKLKALGLGLVVVTNQSAIGRGYFGIDRLELIHKRMTDLLEMEGAFLDAIYYCPHKPEDECICRKPRTGLLELAANELDFDPDQSFVIGDKQCDIQLGRNAGALTFLVCTGYGAELAVAGLVQPDFVVDDVSGAVSVIEKLLIDKDRIEQK